MNKKLISILLFGFSGFLAVAQDPVFSQPYANPLYLNPAFAGIGTSQRIGLNFRDEWPAIPGNFIAYGFSYDRNIIDSNFGIGVLGLQNRAGQNTMITTNASLILSYQFHIKSFTLSVGAQGTFGQKIVNQSQLAFGDMLDPRRGFVYNTQELLTRTTVNYPDFSAGFLGYGKNYFAGFSVDHLTQPNQSFAGAESPLPIRVTANAGAIIQAGKYNIMPAFLYMQQQDFTVEQVQCYLSRKYFTFGLGYRWNDAMIFTVGFHYRFLIFGYSYDLTVSKLTEATGGSHELSLAILLHYKSAKLKKVNGFNGPCF